MCGICGVINLGGTERLEFSTLKSMTDVIAHRGPDDDGFYIDSHVALGMRRLSIIDLNTGSQPIHNEDKTVWVVLNGEIYNFPELKSKLTRQGHHFYTKTDTEVLVHLYEEFGENFLRDARGMFGVALWDIKNRTFILARDRLGVKPLYYSMSQSHITFGSEIKSILKSGLATPSLNLRAADLYLSLGYVPAPLTMFDKILKLHPAHMLVCHNGKASIKEYWRIPQTVERGAKKPTDQYVEEFLALLHESIRMRLISDVPLGLMLSGGLDSSAIAAVMSEIGTTPIKTFSVGFRGDPKSELNDARKVANFFQTDHYELVTSFDQHIGILPNLVWHMDEPIADLSAIGFYFISKLAREKVTVALSGQGADELLAGYRKYIADKISPYYQMLPSRFRHGLLIPLARKIPRAALVKKAVEALSESGLADRYIRSSAVFSDTMKSKLVSPVFHDIRSEHFLAEIVDNYLAETKSEDSLTKMLYLDIKLPLADDLLTYFDKISMANSLEVRVPFMDHKLVEFCAALPPNLKLRGLTTKYLLRKSMAPRLPIETMRKKKIGFFAHGADGWMRNEMKEYVYETLLDPSSLSRGYFEPKATESLLNEHMAGRQNFGRQIFSLLLLEIWHRVFLDQTMTPDSLPASELKTEAL